MKKLVVDTDAFTDDVSALLLALTHPDATVFAITTVSGSYDIDVSQVVANVSRIRRLANKPKIPIYKGCNGALLPSLSRVTGSFAHGADGIGDQPETEPKLRPEDLKAHVKDEPAASALVNLARNYKGEITLVCIGPLTNVALAVRMDPSFGSNVKEMFLMGGGLQAVGNVTSTAEYNFYADPEAAHIVLSEMRCPMTIAPWNLVVDLRDKLKNNPALRLDEHLNAETAIARFLSDISGMNNRFGRGFADEVAMAAAIEPAIVMESKQIGLTVELQGRETRGQLVANHKSFPYRQNASVILNYDVAMLCRMMNDMVKYKTKIKQ